MSKADARPGSLDGVLMETFLEDSCQRVDRYLDAALAPESEPPARLHRAMRYAVFSGGKRLRPALAFAAAQACGADPDRVLPVAGAVELVHAYSLVHDDLPAMDDDAVRRGRATVHIEFGEATAILVGDGLQTLAFEVLAGAGVPADVIALLARAAGSRGLVGGQEEDLRFSREDATPEAIESIHRGKTAQLFVFAVVGAARALGAPGATVARLETYGRSYGLAFQLVDDLAEAGDPAKQAECSALRVLPADQVAARARDHLERARQAVTAIEPGAGALEGLAEQLLARLP